MFMHLKLVPAWKKKQGPKKAMEHLSPRRAHLKEEEKMSSNGAAPKMGLVRTQERPGSLPMRMHCGRRLMAILKSAFEWFDRHI